MSKEPNERQGDPYLEARYTNYVEIGHNSAEFVIDCGQRYGDDEPRFHTRLVMVPLHAHDLFDLLRRSLDEHERARSSSDHGGSGGS